MLEQASFNAPDGSVYVITSYRNTDKNFRTRLQRIIARARLTPWPKLFQNLRSTCETELAESFPTQVVCSWKGHSHCITLTHYLNTTDAHFETAINGRSAESGAVALHFQAQHTAARTSIDGQEMQKTR